MDRVLNLLQKYQEYMTNINNLSNTGSVVIATYSGFFTLVAILPAAYALINRHIEKEFIGMPVTRMKRYKIIWLIIPVISMFGYHAILVTSDANFECSLIISFLFTIYLCVYLYFILMPLFNKNKFYESLKKLFIQKILNEPNWQTYASKYLIEFNKSYAQNEYFGLIDYEEIIEAMKLKVNTDVNSAISNMYLQTLTLMYIKEDISKFIIHIDTLKINIIYKFRYLIQIFNQLREQEVYNTKEFSIKVRDFLRGCILENNEYIHDEHNDYILVLLDCISNTGSIDLLIDEIYSAYMHQQKYIKLIVFYILTEIGRTSNFESKSQIYENQVLIRDLEKFLNSEIIDFTCKNKFNNIDTIEIILKALKLREVV